MAPVTSPDSVYFTKWAFHLIRVRDPREVADGPMGEIPCRFREYRP